MQFLVAYKAHAAIFQSLQHLYSLKGNLLTIYSETSFVYISNWHKYTPQSKAAEYLQNMVTIATFHYRASSLNKYECGQTKKQTDTHQS